MLPVGVNTHCDCDKATTPPITAEGMGLHRSGWHSWQLSWKDLIVWSLQGG